MGHEATIPNLNLQRSNDDPLTGTLVNNRYKVLSVVATGGMGRIYKAEQLPLGRAVALKVLNPRYTNSTEDESFQQRFFLEASLLSKLQHPNIVTVFDYGRVEGLEQEIYFMAMEYLAGETLHTRLNRCQTLSPAEAVGLAKQVAHGLREAHGNDIVHRDLKPSNLMIVRKEDGIELVKIIDFGLVKLLTDDSDQVTKEGTFLGSPRYMSPEQISQGQMDLRADIYSLGVILYETLCGQLPFDSNHAIETLMAHLNAPVPEMRARSPNIAVPELLEAFVRRCMSKRPEARPENMEAFARELGEIEAALGITPGGKFDYDTGSVPRRSMILPTGEVSRALQAPAEQPNLAITTEQPTRLFIDGPGPAARRPIWIAAVVAFGVLLVGATFLFRGAKREPSSSPSESSSSNKAETNRLMVGASARAVGFDSPAGDMSATSALSAVDRAAPSAIATWTTKSAPPSNPLRTPVGATGPTKASTSSSDSGTPPNSDIRLQR